MTIQNDGNVGIGITAPVAELHLGANSSSMAIHCETHETTSTSFATFCSISIDSGTYTRMVVEIVGSQTGHGAYIDSEICQRYYLTTANNQVLSINGADHFTDDSGTTTDTYFTCVISGGDFLIQHKDVTGGANTITSATIMIHSNNSNYTLT